MSASSAAAVLSFHMTVVITSALSTDLLSLFPTLFCQPVIFYNQKHSSSFSSNSPTLSWSLCSFLLSLCLPAVDLSESICDSALAWFPFFSSSTTDRDKGQSVPPSPSPCYIVPNHLLCINMCLPVHKISTVARYRR